MALTVTRKWSGPTSAGESDDEGRNVESNASEHYELTADSNNYTPVSARYEAMLTGLIPRIGSVHSSDPNLICRQIECDQRAPFFFYVQAIYRKPGADDEDPDLQPAEISFEHIVTEEPIDQDVNGQPIATILGESFDPPISRPVADLFIRVSKNVASFDPVAATVYMYRVNSDTFLGFPAGTLLIEQFSAVSVLTATAAYWRRTIGIHVRRGAPNTTDAKAWFRRVRAEGFRVKFDLLGTDKDGWARDESGELVSKPVLHDKETGERINDPADAQWYEFEIYQSIEFSPLGFT